MNEESTGDIALVVGAGGPTGGPFIWSALEELTARTGWDPTSASQVIGTSAGAFVAARFGERTAVDADALAALRQLANGHEFSSSLPTRAIRVIRTVGGRLVARLSPLSRDIAEYGVPEGPYHEGASAVTVQRSNAKRVHHRLRSVEAEAVVRASAAIPFVNKPIDVEGKLHVDGATHSANNADLVAGTPDVVVVVSPMIPATDGKIVSRAHRAQLRGEVQVLLDRGAAVVLILPSAQAHATRRDRERFAPEGAVAVRRL